jgi:hypothetical protein
MPILVHDHKNTQMNKVKRIATSALLVSFTNDNGGDKNKKYQIIHHEKGEMITYDTVIPMSSSFTPEQFLAEKGILDEHVEIITLPSISAMDIDGKAMRTIIREIEMDGADSGEEVEINVGHRRI